MSPYLKALLAIPFFAIVAAVAQPAFRLMSADIPAGGTVATAQVFNDFGCQGSNISPELHWSGAPAGTKSYALTMYDPDAPTGSGWWHWIVYNIPATTDHLAAGAGAAGKNLLPEGAVMGNGDMGSAGYQGPCPGKGDKPHHYVLTLFALDTDRLDLPPAATAAYVGYNLNMHKLAKTTLTATYGR